MWGIMTLLNKLSCCGVSEIDGLQSPVKTLKDVCDEYFISEVGRTYVIFTDVFYSTKGERLVKYIKLNKLGVIYGTKYKTNINSGNMIKLWVWSPHDRNLKKWWKKHY